MYEQLEEILGIHFQNSELLALALTHRSFLYDAAGAGYSSNERLEFLGDSILAFISADFLYRTYPALSEGELTDARAFLVRTETLAQFAREIGLGTFLRVGKGEREQETTTGSRVLAATFEAVLGALYLDQGLQAVQHFLLPRLEPLAENIVNKRLFKDNKSRFQQMVQGQEGITPSYRIASQEGPSHNREFTVEVMIGENIAGTGHGRSKQIAEQEAAHNALVSRGWN